MYGKPDTVDAAAGYRCPAGKSVPFVYKIRCIAVSAGAEHTVGLKSDGSVVAVGGNGFGCLGVNSWRNIVAVSAGVRNTIGLKSDGTLVCAGDFNFEGMCNVYGYKLFDSFENLEKERQIKTAEANRIAEEKRIAEQRAQLRSQNLCQYCGGTFKGMFTKKCTNCGREKDY